MSTSVSLCCLKIEIDKNAAMKGDDDDQGAGAVGTGHGKTTKKVKKQSNVHRGQRKSKAIKIESFRNKNIEGAVEGLLPSGSREATPSTEPVPTAQPQLQVDDKSFFAGSPFVEVTKGIIHMYKNNERSEIKEGLSKIICLLAVPATLNCHDLLNFVAPCHPTLQHIRIICDGTPNQFMVLLEFRSVETALEFYKTFNGAPYNSFEPDSLCHAVWVSSVEFGHDDVPPRNHNELPVCAVCLEHLDENVLTILCNHAFHANCLIKWGDSTCPVCRYVQTPELSESSVCMECEGTEGLWICLICGHVGCGRYQGGHAASHYRATNHTYALQLGSNRVWDYAGDNFVHRLLQSKTDGKLVATQSPGDCTENSEEKIDSMQLEFTYLLTSQLDAQREYYEDRLARLESRVDAEAQKTKSKTDAIMDNCAELETKYSQLKKDKASLEKKLSQLNSKLSTCQKELTEECVISQALRSNQSGWESKCQALNAKFEKYQNEKEAEICELKEQIRDLMFYMEAQNVISKSDLKDEIATSSVTIPQSNEPETSKKNRRKSKNNK